MRRFQFFLIITLFTLPTFCVRAQSVDILWQGEDYTPPFYQGKNFWSKQSRITFVAAPQGLGSPTNLNYRWTKDGTILGNINGVGKNTISFVDSILSKGKTVDVEIVSGQKVLARASVFVKPVAPTLAVYENNPLYGFMFHREVGETYDIGGQEITFTMFPLFVSAFGRADSILNYGWETNGKTTGSAYSATYLIPENTSGTSRIEASFSNIDKITQRGSKSFLVQFENQ